MLLLLIAKEFSRSSCKTTFTDEVKDAFTLASGVIGVVPNLGWVRICYENLFVLVSMTRI